MSRSVHSACVRVCAHPLEKINLFLADLLSAQAVTCPVMSFTSCAKGNEQDQELYGTTSQTKTQTGGCSVY